MCNHTDPKKRNVLKADMKYACKFCNRKYDTPDKLACHVSSAHFSKGYQCTLCDKILGSRHSLQVHMDKQVHVSRKCMVCETELCTALRKKTAEREDATGPFLCSNCVCLEEQAVPIWRILSVSYPPSHEAHSWFHPCETTVKPRGCRGKP